MFLRLRPVSLVIALLFLFAVGHVSAAAQTPSTVESKFPRLSSGPLHRAVVVTMTGGVVLSAGGIKITTNDVAKEIAKSPESLRAQLKQYSFFALEQAAVRKFLANEAAAWASKKGVSAKGDELIGKYLQSVVPRRAVTDEEARQFYSANRSMFGAATFDQVRASVKSYLGDEKWAVKANAYANAISNRNVIQVSRVWANQQYQKWIKNPVEQARRSGKPSLVDFGRAGCKPCDMMAPVFDELRKKHKGKANVVFVHTGKEPVLASHYGISVVPTQIFFDKSGKQTVRHEGYLDKASIEEKLRQMGVK